MTPPPLEEEENYIEEAPFVPPTASELPPLDELKPKILKALRDERHSLAAAMEKSGNWSVEGSVITLSFNSPFESTFIEKESREIENMLKKSLGLNLQIKTVVKQIKKEALKENVDDQVKLVQNIFRGTLINRSK
ncbi:MAG: hypothetical protein PQJ50_08635 [Spirochaetales bacterium]|nr:hypothetical protein [Spirochaetales bacterium]